ncbi:MAG TPA: DUF2177 family protein [Candidatus Omnitrophota bacterium]|nr:DUF2177 family protein [Candidatus Omnitrophota bacterium]
MKLFMKYYAIALIAFVILDGIWLGFIGGNIYKKYIGFLLSEKPNWMAAIIFYLLFVAGIVVFVVLPGMEEKSLWITAGRAALFGLVTYATYDLTNLATIKSWPVQITIIDLIWGTCLSSFVGLTTIIIARWIQ